MEDVTRYLNTRFVHDEDKVSAATRKPHFLDDNEIFDENEEPTGYEIKSKKKTVTDDKPIHFATAILQWSKYLFQRYVSYDSFHMTHFI